MSDKNIQRIAIFASGGGSNAKNILEYFSSNLSARVSQLYTNNLFSGLFEFANTYDLGVQLLRKNQYSNGDYLIKNLKANKISWIVLAGYLKKIPAKLVEAYPNRILNIHPSLLPAFGGKGMYGIRVHQAVIEAAVPTSGMTIHFVNQAYDEGEILFQAELNIPEGMTPELLQRAILKLEHKYYPRIIENVILSFPN